MNFLELLQDIIRRLLLLFKGYSPGEVPETPSEEEPRPGETPVEEKHSIPLEIWRVELSTSKDVFVDEPVELIVRVHFNRKPEYGDPDFPLDIYANGRRIDFEYLYPIPGANPSEYRLYYPLEEGDYDIYARIVNEESNHIHVKVIINEQRRGRAPPRRRRGIEPIPI